MMIAPIHRFGLIAIALMGMLVGCQTRQDSDLSLPKEAPQEIGTVQEIGDPRKEVVEGGGPVGVGVLRALVEGQTKMSDGEPRLTWVTVAERSQVLMLEEGKLSLATPSDVRAGLKVRIWYQGAVLKSYPGQAHARIILIEGSAATMHTEPPTNPDAAAVLHQFAELVSKGDVESAAGLLGTSLRGVYVYQDYAPMRNTPTMEIVALEEMPGTWQADVGARDQKVAEAHVFALDVRYKVLGLIDSDFKDGEVYQHKATVAKYTADGPWLITELSGGARRQPQSR